MINENTEFVQTQAAVAVHVVDAWLLMTVTPFIVKQLRRPAARWRMVCPDARNKPLNGEHELADLETMGNAE